MGFFSDLARAFDRAFGAPEKSTNRVGPVGMTPSSLAPMSSPRPQPRPTPSLIGGPERDGPDKPPTPTTPTTPVAPPAPPTTPEIPPVAPPPTPPSPPAPVNPSDMTSTGPSEDLALESASQGLASTILTSGQGIIEEEPGLLRPRRKLGNSLISQGLIQ